ncbi:MAG: TRC40/GET3/ArsA family transport-energizing ATPase [Deltaproteobacteria bacterium]|nr:TRC40/GET3/ArsA family transport-energizing ATPase [Deltaproteobacteria bacterium]
MIFIDNAARYLFFAGKGGVGKTSIACASAVTLADRGRNVLIVSTDPASNLDAVLGVALSPRPTPILPVSRLFALNIDPQAAAKEYRERLIAPYKGVLPEAEVARMEERLASACSVEIAAFDQFSGFLADDEVSRQFDHVLFDTAPTGHTLRHREINSVTKYTPVVATSPVRMGRMKKCNHAPIVISDGNR